MPTIVGSGGREFELTDQWIYKVAETTDDELRAHQIILTLSLLAIKLDELIHGTHPSDRKSLEQSSTNANWFHFATWANMTVTNTLRAEGAPPPPARGLIAPLRRRLTPAVLQARASQGQRVGRALAWGQRLIFVGTCLALLDFYEQAGKGGQHSFAAFRRTQSTRAEKITELTTWGGRAWFDTDRHLEPIWRALELYELAQANDNPAVKARLVLGGNLLLTAVDQDLVNPALQVVVDNVPQRLVSDADWVLARLASRVRGVPPQLAYAVLQSRHLSTRRALESVWSWLVTGQVLVMTLPTETLRLGRDIPPRHRQWPYYPPDLRDLRSFEQIDTDLIDDDTKVALEDVARHVDSLDRSAGDGHGSGARDWRAWDERMNWVASMMRSRQQDETLFWQPYSEADQERIMVGQLPLRAGDPSALRVQPPIGLGVFPTGPAGVKSQR